MLRAKLLVISITLPVTLFAASSVCAQVRPGDVITANDAHRAASLLSPGSLFSSTKVASKRAGFFFGADRYGSHPPQCYGRSSRSHKTAVAVH